MATDKNDDAPLDIVAYLKKVLLELAANPYPEVANPPSAPRRASVALILRIQPSYGNWPPNHVDQSGTHGCHRRHSATSDREIPSLKNALDAFFSQEWVKHGDPEVMFIKRSERKGDRWTSHIALPGGRRDPEDKDDQATAVREAKEEVGIDLSCAHALAVGNLPQRVVTVSWGKVPLMVLCPYVFLLTQHDVPPLRLQPTEVGSTHWVPIRALLSPQQRVYESQDFSHRLAYREMGIRRWAVRMMLGRMLFAAIQLVPTESQYCSSISDFVLETNNETTQKLSVLQHFFKWWRTRRPPNASPNREKPLLLWGLTLGVISDFLELLPPHDALEFWEYPTFTPWDVRFTLWAMSYSFRKRKQQELALFGMRAPRASDKTTNEANEKPPQVKAAGLDAGLGGNMLRTRQTSRNNAIGSLLEGYYAIVRKAVATALIARLSIVIVLIVTCWRKWNHA